MAKETPLTRRESGRRAVDWVIDRLRYRQQEAPIQAATSIQPDFHNDGGNSRLGFAPIDPFIAHNVIQRQTFMVEKYENIFLHQNEAAASSDCCDSCSRIDFDAIYNHLEISLGGSTAFSLQAIGIVDDTWSKRACPLCRFLAAIWVTNKSYLRNSNLWLVLLSSGNMSKYTGSIQAPNPIRHRNILLLSHPQPQRVFDVDHATLDNLDIVGPLFLTKHKLEVEKCVSVRQVKPNRTDFSVIRGWLQLCSKHHGDRCFSSEVRDIPGFQLLNCQTRKLEQYTPGIEFVALSYVWGSSINDQMRVNIENDCSLLPQTIEDALRVTLELGFHYIWVDRYCLPKLDGRLKHTQIASMDLIFSSATLTVVAAGGHDSSFGLPGVSNRSRPPQPSIPVGAYDVVSALSNPVRDVRNSKWMNRGWTYQEALLSKRRLFFTEKQAYFECGEMTSMETVAEPEDFMAARGGAAMKGETHCGMDNALPDTRYRLFPVNHLDLISQEPWLIHQRIAEYTTRSLTFESDSLNAFLGVLNHFKNPKCSTSQVWGVPVLWSSATWSAVEGFATGLCWTGFFSTGQVAKRRFGFPSWSWAGWRMAISPRSAFYRCGFKTPYQVRIDIETQDGTILDWATFQTASQASAAPMLSQYLHIESWSLKCRLYGTTQIPGKADASLRSYWSLTTEDSNVKLDRVVIHKQYSSEEWNARSDKLWDILIIGNPENPVTGATQFFEQHAPFGPFFMILEDMGEYFERVGYLDLAHGNVDSDPGQDMSIHLVGKKRRSFRLG